MDDWFDDRKAAQVAAFFCRAAGGSIDVLKLVKLIYLADRKSMERCAFPITNDRFVSMPHGPVNSLTYSCMDGSRPSEAWSDLISARSEHKVALARPLTDDDMDELSAFDIDILNAVWDEFGHMAKYAIRDWTHNHCPEWRDPHGSSLPLPHVRVLKALGVEGAEAIAKEIESERVVNASLRQFGA